MFRVLLQDSTKQTSKIYHQLKQLCLTKKIQNAFTI
jgi:hypothetical protein